MNYQPQLVCARLCVHGSKRHRAIGIAMGGWVDAGGWRGWRKEGMNKKM